MSRPGYTSASVQFVCECVCVALFTWDKVNLKLTLIHLHPHSFILSFLLTLFLCYFVLWAKTQKQALMIIFLWLQIWTIVAPTSPVKMAGPAPTQSLTSTSVSARKVSEDATVTLVSVASPYHTSTEPLEKKKLISILNVDTADNRREMKSR